MPSVKDEIGRHFSTSETMDVPLGGKVLSFLFPSGMGDTMYPARCDHALGLLRPHRQEIKELCQSKQTFRWENIISCICGLLYLFDEVIGYMQPENRRHLNVPQFLKLKGSVAYVLST